MVQRKKRTVQQIQVIKAFSQSQECAVQVSPPTTNVILTNGPAEVLHQHLCLLDLCRINFTPHHGAERHLTTQLLSNSQS